MSATIVAAALGACGGHQSAPTSFDTDAPVTLSVLGPDVESCDEPFPLRIELRSSSGFELTRGFPFRIEVDPGGAGGTPATARLRDAVVATRSEHQYVLMVGPEAGPVGVFRVRAWYSVCSDRACTPGVTETTWTRSRACDNLPQ